MTACNFLLSVQLNINSADSLKNRSAGGNHLYRRIIKALIIFNENILVRLGRVYYNFY